MWEGQKWKSGGNMHPEENPLEALGAPVTDSLYGVWEVWAFFFWKIQKHKNKKKIGK